MYVFRAELLLLDSQWAGSSVEKTVSSTLSNLSCLYSSLCSVEFL